MITFEGFPNCCGIDVIHSFGCDDEGEETKLSELLSNTARCTLIALGDYQLDKKRRALIKKKGFVKLFRFKNDNSGNFVTVFKHMKKYGR